MRGRGIANWLAGLSLLLAVGALALLLSWQEFYRGETSFGLTHSRSLIEENGPRVLVWLIPPVVVALLGFLASFWQTQVGKFATWAAAVLLLTFAFVTGFTIGWAYVPAALVLLVSALFLATRVGRSAALATAILLLLMVLTSRWWPIWLLYLPAAFALLVVAATARTASPGTSPA